MGVQPVYSYSAREYIRGGIMPREDAAEIRWIDRERGEACWKRGDTLEKRTTFEEKAKRNGERANGEKQTDLSESTGLTTCLPASRYATGWGFAQNRKQPPLSRIYTEEANRSFVVLAVESDVYPVDRCRPGTHATDQRPATHAMDKKGGGHTRCVHSAWPGHI